MPKTMNVLDAVRISFADEPPRPEIVVRLSAEHAGVRAYANFCAGTPDGNGTIRNGVLALGVASANDPEPMLQEVVTDASVEQLETLTKVMSDLVSELRSSRAQATFRKCAALADAIEAVSR